MCSFRVGESETEVRKEKSKAIAMCFVCLFTWLDNKLNCVDLFNISVVLKFCLGKQADRVIFTFMFC